MTAATPVSTEHIKIVEGVTGPKAQIVGHRIRVKDIVIWHEHRQMSVDEIIELFPQLTRSDIHAALACYWDNKDDIDALMAANDAMVDRDRQVAPPSRFAEKLKQLESQ
ncbi:MAG TPA: DUF433 domain-containing protein [Thermomicrobiales bacterium]|nr:DUF433 domain-containing protein [Thermomicrobiales bacterium]